MSSQQHKFKRPDVSVRDKKLDTLNVQLKKIDTEIGLIRKQIDQHQVNDTTQQERKKLQDKNKEIIKIQADLKTRRSNIHDSIKQLDAQIKRKNNQIEEKLGKKAKFSSTAEAKQRINEIEESIASGDLSLVQEKLLVKEMQSLNKLIKDLVNIEPIRKSVDADKAKINQLKEELNGLNPKDVSNQFEENQQKLNDIHSKTQGVYDKRQTLFNKRAALYKKRDELYSQIRQIRADFDNEFKSFRAKLDKERLKREEEQRLSKLLEQKDVDMGKLQEKLTHAKIPAFTYEIGAIENSLLVLDPTYVKPKKNILPDLSSNALETKPARKVVADDLVLVTPKKDDFVNVAPSKSKKYKKKNQQKNTENEQPASIFNKVDGKFTLEPTLIATLAELDVTVPINSDDVKITIEQLKKKHEELLSKQEEQTKQNIESVEKEIEKLNLDYSNKEQQVKKELEEKRLKEQEESEKDKEN